MKRKLLALIVIGSAIGLVKLQAGSGKSAGIGIGAGLGGFFLGRATAPRERVVQRETVYVEQPTRTVTVDNPALQSELRSMQDQLVQERSKRLALEAELVTLRGKHSDLEREHERLKRKYRKYKKQLLELQTGATK